MDSPTLMSIQQMIDAAFGDPRISISQLNVVNHKLIHAVLIILARQIRILERQVHVNLGPIYETASTTSINVSEIKMQTTVRKKQQKGTATSGAGITGGSSLHRKSSSERTTILKSTSDKTKTSLTLSKQPSKSRANSREEQKKSPSPMASLDAIEKRYEKLLIVERVPTEQDGRPRIERDQRLSIVTQEEFSELAAAVKCLQDQYFPAGFPGFPENVELLEEFRKGASLTDAMAVLQLSARLEAAEKALEKMISLVTDVAKSVPPQATETTSDLKSGVKPRKDTKGELIYKDDDATYSASKKFDSTAKSKGHLRQKTGIESTRRNETDSTEQEIEKGKKDWITAEELDDAMQDIYEEFMKIINTNTSKSNSNAHDALKIVHKLEQKMEESLNLGERMEEVETLVSGYVEHINALDAILSSQITNYQEQLTQMQHDLEAGIETMQEALTNTGGDTAAVMELNTNFTNLQVELDTAAQKQKELGEEQHNISLELEALWKQIEILRDEKSNRDEVADALRDKAGISALNGLVGRPEFDAVRGDLEKQIGAAYKKFNNQEVTWQKAIDELLRELSEKADLQQVVSLQESIAKYLEKINNRINAMMEIVGEPRAAAVSRKLHRDAACLSCKTPAHMDMEELNIWPTNPEFPSRPPTVGAETATKPSEDGDHNGVCYPGYPIPHPIDPRSHVCHRFCGGSHTILNHTISRVPPSMVINTVPASPRIATVIGTDGKAYVGDHVLTPCKTCYIPEKPIMTEITAPEIPLDTKSSGMTPPDYRMSVLSDMKKMGSEEDGEASITPPPLSL